MQTGVVHHVQSKILKRLLYVDDANYAKLRPDKVESNLFAYHLEQLLKDGLVAKTDARYTLSPKGLAHIDRLSHLKMKRRLQPHIVTAIDVTTPDGKTLLFKRSFQPFIHLVGFPLGKVHFDESVPEAAARELQEKTGLTGLTLHHRGMVYIDAKRQGVTTSKVLYHVFHADVPDELPAQTPPERGECFWADHKTLASKTLMPGFLRVKELLASNPSQFFFDELTEGY